MGENMTDDYKKQLKRLLRNLFQFDSADLDFGIYRIMNKKRDEIERFIEEDLIDAVEAGFGEYSESKGASLKDEFEAIKAEILENLGEDALDESGGINQIYVTTPFAKKLADRYDKAHAALKDADMSDQQEAEVFSHIYQFFSRYYDNGDFMSLRRYSQKEKYAIPYNGEEVVLHWANKDQYYIKTGENFKNYSFKMGEYTVEFLIREAEGTTNNNKAEKRFFVLASSGDNLEYDESNKILTIFFEYRGLSKDEEREYGTRNVQEAILAQIKEDIPAQVLDSGLKGALNRVVDKGKDNEKTVLEKHLRAYTKKNTTDYFIHKDLKGFLTLELDFYIKNEVFHLDDLGSENAVGVEQYVSRVRVMKSICLKVIDFLAQIEDFQKMLFEKKKFVVSTDYCMTLDNVPEEMYAEILGNEAQLEEWRVLYGIGEDEQATLGSFGSEGIDEGYLRECPYLVVDTKFFNQEFKDKLLVSFDEIDEATDGLMINSENLQALNLMQHKYKEKVKCIYIDPPFNTGNDEFIYKDNYQHSSWLTMIENRLHLGKELLPDNGAIYVSIDDREASNLMLCLYGIFDKENVIAELVWEKVHTRKNSAKYYSIQHEYVSAFAKNKLKWNRQLLRRDDTSAYTNSDNDPKGPWKPDPITAHNPYSADYKIVKPNGVILSRPKDRYWAFSEENWLKKVSENAVVWGEGNSYPMIKRYLNDVQDGLVPVSLFKRDDYEDTTILPRSEFGDTSYAKKELGLLFPNELAFDYPKPTKLIHKLLEPATTSNSNDIILDFFAGSGTTAHAAINLNKEDSGNRKYILVEMGNYFDTVTKPRIQKVMYSSDWKDGKPQSTDGISHIFKYQTLEQYEDTLNNIEFTESGTVQRTLGDMDGYFLRYMLDFETRGSSCRFNVTKLKHPFSYTLKITEGSELKEQTVDLVETFNYLLGLHIRKIRTFTYNGTYYRVVLGSKDEDDIAVIWRDTEDLDLKEDKTFIEETILSELNPAKTYINADFYVEGAHPVEPEFNKLMVG